MPLPAVRPPQSRHPDNARNAIEPGIEAQYALNTVLLHDSNMQRIASRKSPMAQNDFFRPFCGSLINGENLIHDSEQGIECRLNGVTPVYCNVSV